MISSTPSRALLLAVCVTCFRLASADPKDARAWVSEGNQQYQLGHFEAATVAYEKAYELTSAPGILYNLAQCHRMEGHFERAAFYYQRYLSLARRPIGNETMTRQLLAECQQKADERASADDAARKAEEARRVAVDQLTRAEEARRRADVEVARYEDARRGMLELKVEPAAGTPITRKWWFWTAVGVVVVGVGTAAGVVATRPSRPAASLGDISF